MHMDKKIFFKNIFLILAKTVAFENSSRYRLLKLGQYPAIYQDKTTVQRLLPIMLEEVGKSKMGGIQEFRGELLAS